MLSVADYVARADELLRLERYDLALQEVQRALEQDPNSADAHVSGAWILRGQGKFAEAETAARAALALNPHLADGHDALACVLWSRNRLAEAEAAFRTTLACADDPNRAMHLCNYTRLLSAMGRYGDALATADQALTLTPSSSIAHEVRGTALHGLGRSLDAATAYRTALRINPRNFNALNKLGRLELRDGQIAAALECFRDALRLRPGHPDARANLVLALKARSPLYGWMLAQTLSQSRRWRNVLRVLVAGAFLLPALISLTVGEETQPGRLLYQAWEALLGVLVLGFCVTLVWKWIVDPIFDTLLLRDPLGRQAVEYDLAKGIRVGAVAALLLGLLGYSGLVLTVGPDAVISQLAGALIITSVVALLIPAGHPSLSRRARRLLWLGYSGMILGTLLLAVGLILDFSVVLGLGAGLLDLVVVAYLIAEGIHGMRRAMRQGRSASRWRIVAVAGLVLVLLAALFGLLGLLDT